MSGRLIVIEGLDGSGKATQAQLLYEALLSENKPVKKISFPDYESDSSALVKMYLGGEFGSKPEDVNAYAASSFYAVDRYASFKKDWGQFYNEGYIVIADRYTTSNAIHQCSKLPEKQWDAFLEWLFTYEYQLLSIPAPDTVLYLQTDVATSQRMMTHRYSGHEEKKDIHESDLRYMERSWRAAEYCKDKLGWKTVACVINGAMRDMMDIHKEIAGCLSLDQGEPRDVYS